MLQPLLLPRQPCLLCQFQIVSRDRRTLPPLSRLRSNLISLSFQEIALARLLPELGEDVSKLAPHAKVLALHARSLVPLLPLFSDNMAALVRNLDVLIPSIDALLPLAPKLARYPKCLPYLLQPRVLKVMLQNMDAIPMDRIDEVLPVLPLIAPYLEQMAEEESLDLILQRSESLLPLVDLVGDSIFASRLPLLISHAKQLLPYTEQLMPFARELVGYSDELLEHWSEMEPYMDQIIEVFPLVQKHIPELVANIDELCAKMPLLAPVMTDLAVYSDKICPHMTKLLQHSEALMKSWPDLQPHLPVLMEEIDFLMPHIDELVPQLPYLAPHIGEIVPVISKTVQFTPYLLRDYGGMAPYLHHVLSIPGAASLLPTLGAFAQQWHALIDGGEVPSTPVAKATVAQHSKGPETPLSESRRSSVKQKTLCGEWELDDSRSDCYLCKTPFTWSRRRHHCRGCGRLVCGKCSVHLILYKELGEIPVRACDECKQNLQPHQGVVMLPAAMLAETYY